MLAVDIIWLPEIKAVWRFIFRTGSQLTGWQVRPGQIRMIISSASGSHRGNNVLVHHKHQITSGSWSLFQWSYMSPSQYDEWWALFISPPLAPWSAILPPKKSTHHQLQNKNNERGWGRKNWILNKLHSLAIGSLALAFIFTTAAADSMQFCSPRTAGSVFVYQ